MKRMCTALIVLCFLLQLCATGIDDISTVPSDPPAFTARIEWSGQGYVLMGHFTDFLSDTQRVTPLYSLDGETYQPIALNDANDWDISDLGTEDPLALDNLQNDVCAYLTDHPFSNYLSGEIDDFYIKLEITLADGQIYHSAPYHLERGGPQSIPDGANVAAIFSGVIRYKDFMWGTAYGKYTMTVSETATAADISAFLPETVPVEIQITPQDDPNNIQIGTVNMDVTWNLPAEIDPADGILPDVADPILIPAGTQVTTPMGIYTLPELSLDGPGSSDELRLFFNPVAEDEAPTATLWGSYFEEHTTEYYPLKWDFDLKPTGATELMAYAFVEGDEDWTTIGDLLERKPVDATPNATNYGQVEVLQPQDAPYKDYLDGENTGFTVAVVIKGGTYDGQTVMLPWPETYEIPTQVPDISGSGGNEGNVGTPGGGDSSSGGQRPTVIPTPKPNPPQTEGDTTTVTAQVTPSTGYGISTASVSADLANLAVTSALSAATEAQTAPAVIIEIPTPDYANSLVVGMSTTSLAQLAVVADSTFTIASDVGDITFDAKALTQIVDKSSGRITLSLRKADAIANRPTYDLTLSSGSTQLTTFGQGTATVTLPYNLQKGEVAEGIVVYHVDETGRLTELDGAFDAETGHMTFTTGHFSLYQVGYDPLKLWQNPFTDIAVGQWFYEGVAFSNQSNLMVGTTATTFSPTIETTRGMLATVLARTEDIDTEGGHHWYSKGMDWAVSQHISDGSNPAGNLTRQEMATMLWRTAKSPATTQRLATFADNGDIADYAQEAMAWAVERGIIQGIDGTLAPQKTVTRGEFATMLARYLTQ